MSQTALQNFANIAQQLADALDKHKPTQGNQTLLVLADLSNELPEDNPLRKSIEQQMAKIAATDFNLDNQDLNKTLIVLGSLKGRLDSGDMLQDKIDLLMAKVLAAKFDIVNGQVPGGVDLSTIPSSAPEPEAAQDSEPTPEPEAAPDPEPSTEGAQSPAGYSISIPDQEPATPEPEVAPEAPQTSEPTLEPQPEPESDPEPEAAPADSATTELADQIHALQLNLDQVPVATKLAFEDLKNIEEKGGTIQGYLDALDQSGSAEEKAARVKTELERISVLLNKIDDAPAEADQFQVLYDQVDPKHKDLKTGVFSIFQREYAGNARRFVVERTAQYAKYVPAEESRQRMIEDLHKLTEQAQKCLAQAGQSAAAPAGNNRAFFHG